MWSDIVEFFSSYWSILCWIGLGITVFVFWHVSESIRKHGERR